ncbi:MAG: hypothetical protein KUG61_07525 [Parvibaculaceae bacterium]|nr:hypothetical protein [Parvibaculaceae bacterium]
MKPSPLTRHCTSCGDDNMVATKRRWTGFGYEDDYECPACDYAVALSQPGVAGIQVLGWVLGGLIFTWMWIFNNSYPDAFDYGFVIFIWLIGAFSMLPDALQLYIHHSTGFVTPSDDTSDSSSVLSQSASGFFSKHGFFMAPLLAVLGMIGIMVLAGLIGYVKDYVF